MLCLCLALAVGCKKESEVEVEKVESSEPVISEPAPEPEVKLNVNPLTGLSDVDDDRIDDYAIIEDGFLDLDQQLREQMLEMIGK